MAAILRIRTDYFLLDRDGNRVAQLSASRGRGDADLVKSLSDGYQKLWARLFIGIGVSLARR